MPGHSSSSHSSSSHSSHSSSHSSRSRSHSSSSHSSRSHSSYSSGGHSYSSYSSKPVFMKRVSEFTRSGSVTGPIIPRQRFNQPLGFSSVCKGFEPTNHYGEKHNYVYYPCDWDYDNVSYKRGYYDEEGNYYDRVAFAQKGVYYGILCECKYCGSDMNLNWHPGEVLSCPKCGGNDMEIKTQIDTYTQDPDYTYYNESTNNLGQRTRWAISRTAFATWICCAVIMLLFVVPMILLSWSPVRKSNPVDVENSVSNTDIWGKTVYLVRKSGTEYIISDSPSDYDKKMTWDFGEDSYYERESECFVWYNTDVAPNLWQYYYVGISDKYPDNCGWMEYEPTGWYIETSVGNWVKYDGDTSRFWHIEIDPKDFQ